MSINAGCVDHDGKVLARCFSPCLQSAPHHIVSIQALGQRVYVSDVQESVFYVRYRRQENQLILFADDTNQRWVTATCLLDYDTVAAADKFGNVSVVSIEEGWGILGVRGIIGVLDYGCYCLYMV